MLKSLFRPRIKGIASICLILVLNNKLYSQDTILIHNPTVWDLQRCLDYAKRNNIQINTLRLNQKINQQQLLLSKAALFPDLNASASQTINHRRDQDANLSGTYNLNSGWILYRGGYLRTDIRQRDMFVQSSSLSIMEEENNITLQITSAYLSILLDKETIIYVEDLVKTSRAQLEQARQRFAAGSIAKRDVVQFEAQLATDQYTLTTAQNAQRQDLLNLRTLLQLPRVDSFDIVKPDTVLSELIIPSLQQVQRYAFANRPEIKNSELNVRIAELGLTKARAGYKPTLSASGSIGSNYINNNASAGQFENNFHQQGALTLSIPIFTNRTNKTAVELAKIDIDQAKLDLQNTYIILSQAVEQAYINAINAQGQYNAAKEQFKYNQEVYRIANEELRLGAANIFNFYQQRNLYIQALQNYIRAKYDAALSVSIYNFYLGIPIKL